MENQYNGVPATGRRRPSKMPKLFRVTAILLALGIVTYFTRRSFHKNVDLAKYRVDGWFGAKPLKVGEEYPPDVPDIRPFVVNISNSDLQDLNNRLANARYVDHIEDTQFTYGFNSQYLKEVVEYWRTKYDWRKEEAKLNAFPQFVTQIEGIDIHYVHVKPSQPAKTALPLLIIHGWPGSFLEYYKSLPLLTNPDAYGIAFEVIIPSIPGFGYSEAPHKKGFNAAAAARVFTKLMHRLGHEKFVVHGGDWGNIITRTMSIVYPEKIIGAHIIGNWDAMQLAESPSRILSTLIATYFPSLYFPSENREYEYRKLFPLGQKFLTVLAESGYFHIQATKPDTVAAGLVDSPVGLAAYILEKFSTWTNLAYREREDGGLTDEFSLDELLTNVMIYWTSGNIAASQRFYKENFAEKDEILGQRITVPAGTVDAPQELVRTPRKLVAASYTNLLQYTDLPKGGHFTAFEVPHLVVKDLRSFIKKVLDQQEHIKRQQKLNKSKTVKTKDEI